MKLFHLDPFRVFGLLALMVVLSLPFENQDTRAPNSVPPASSFPNQLPESNAVNTEGAQHALHLDTHSAGSRWQH